MRLNMESRPKAVFCCRNMILDLMVRGNQHAEGTGRKAMKELRSGYALLAALTLLNVLNFADRYLVMSFSNSIIRDLQLTHFQYTLLTGVVFGAIYVVIGLFAGSLADRHHRPRLIAAGLALWSALTAATGLARSFAHIAVARVFIGVGEAVLTPAAMSMLSDRLPPQRHGLAAAVYYLGIPVGIGSSFIFAGVMGPVFGWRATFFMLGAAGVAASLLVLLLMRDPPRGGQAPGAEAQPLGSFRESAAGLWRVWRANPVLGLTLGGAACALFVQGASTLDLVWWVQERGYTESRTQQLTGLIFLSGGIVGALVGGFGADAAYRRDKGGRLKFLALCYVVAIPVGLGYRFSSPDTVLFYACAFVGAASFMIPYGTTFSTVQEVVPVNLRGAAVALMVLFNTLVGHASGAALAGYLADAFRESGMAQPLTWALLLAASPGLPAIPAFWWAARLHARPTEPR
jgi:MFS family permease